MLRVIVYHFNSTLQKYDNYQYAPSFLEKIFLFLTKFKNSRVCDKSKVLA